MTLRDAAGGYEHERNRLNPNAKASTRRAEVKEGIHRPERGWVGHRDSDIPDRHDAAPFRAPRRDGSDATSSPVAPARPLHTRADDQGAGARAVGANAGSVGREGRWSPRTRAPHGPHSPHGPHTHLRTRPRCPQCSLLEHVGGERGVAAGGAELAAPRPQGTRVPWVTSYNQWNDLAATKNDVENKRFKNARQGLLEEM